jgi:two-component system sensor histidine kinase YesM
MTVILITLLLVGVFSYLTASRVLDSQQESRLQQIVNGTAYQSELYLQNYERASSILIADDSMKRFLDIDPDDSYSYITYLDKIRRGSFASAFENFPHTAAIYLLARNGKYALEYNYVTPFFEIENPFELYRSYMKLIGNDSRMQILHRALRPDSRRHVITLIRPMRGYASYDFNGVLALEVDVGELSTLWNKIDLGKGGFFFIVDSDGRYIFHPDLSKFGQQMPEEIAVSMRGDEGARILTDANGERHMLVWKYSAYSRWKLAVSVPLHELRLPATIVRNIVLVVGGFALVFCLWLAYRFAQSIHRPIRLLKEGMRQTERGFWRTIPMQERRDEIGSLILSYNTMVKRLEEMIDKVYKAEIEQQRAEFQALQLQINPHFLYNTLETINCYAVIKDSREIQEIVDAMAFMLRYALHTSLNEITVANELNHVRNYLIVLGHRMEHIFEIDIDIPPHLLLEKMVRFTLQPLVENAFEHGFRKRIMKHHRICIRAWMTDTLFCMAVEDNGLGMTEDKLRKVRADLRLNRLAGAVPEKRKSGGIGMMNVHRRIQLAYGSEYGLSVDSSPSAGTTVTIKMPREGRDRCVDMLT